MVRIKKQGKRSDPAFIKRASALAEEIGVTRAARAFGLTPRRVQSWIRTKRQGRRMTANDTPEQKELIKTKRELYELKRAYEDLKKANLILKEISTFFSKDHSNLDSGWSLKSLRNGKKR